MRAGVLKIRSSGPVLAGALLAVLPLLAWGQQQRPLRVDDLFEIESLARDFGGAVTQSPDGQSVGFTWSRPYKTQSSYNYMTAGSGADTDVWVQARAGAKAVNITQGAKDGTGWWGGVWSADGKRLALLSTRGSEGGPLRKGSAVVWVWDKGSARLRQISTRKVDSLLTGASRALTWLDNRQLLVALQFAEPRSPWSDLPEAQRILVDHWAKNSKGLETTANVLDSGIPWQPGKKRRSQLMLLDTVSGASRVVVDDAPHGWSIAPGGKAVAYYRQTGAYEPSSERKLRPDDRYESFALSIVNLQGKALFTDEAAMADIVSDTLRWSVDGSEFAFVATARSGEAPRVFRGSLTTRRIDELTLDGLDVLPPPDKRQQIEIRWTAAGELLVRAARRETLDAASKGRRDWWVVGMGVAPRCLTQPLQEPPMELWPEEGGASFVGFSAGEIWRVALTGQTHNLTADFERKLDTLAWPQTSYKSTTEMSTPDHAYSKIVLAAREPQQPLDYFSLDLKSGAIEPLLKPDADAQLASFDPTAGSAVFYAAGRAGARLWRTAVASGKAQTLIEANAFLRDIAESEFRLIDYRSLNGQMLKGWLLLPIGYQEGRRYPLLTWVYAGTMIPPKADKPSASHLIGGTGILNMQLAAARGFAVLLPSMPLGPDGGPDDPLLRLTDGVLPAVDKATELGIADADRLFVSGHSFGGYSTFGLVTQTNRFKAAMVHAGTANLINTYGTLVAWMRYGEDANSILTMNMGWAEAGQGRMGNPPWKDQARYIRNSPITYVDRVQTPLLITHGDMDMLGMEDPENFFRSLYRQGKRVQFVRYLGEGHLLASPANIRDLWQRMIGWMDEYGDIQRNAQGDMVFENGRVKGRAATTLREKQSGPK